MKTKALVLTFAVCAVCTGSLAAQQTPNQELAPIVAVEEQERDLAKAERLYKEAIDGGKLSAAAKELATRRLAELLTKLGKRDEAKQWLARLPTGDKGTVVTLDDVTELSPQDREREEALRGKARELVKKVLEQGSFPYPAAGGIFDDELRRQVEWLGEAAVPEIGAALAAAKPTFAGKAASELSPSTCRVEALRGLAGILWRLGSPAARAQLVDACRDGSEAFRALLVTQSARHAPALRELVVTWMNEEPSDAVFWQLARSGDETAGVGLNGQQGWIEGRSNWTELPTEVLLRSFESRSPAMRARALRSLPGWNTQPVVPFAAEAASRACAMIRVLANDTDPETARNALAALGNPRLQLTTAGFECVVEHLGRLGDDRNPNWAGLPREWTQAGNQNVLTMDAAKRLWPKLAAAAIQGVSRNAKPWVRNAIYSSHLAIDGGVLDDLLVLQARGEGAYLRYLSGRLDAKQAMRLARAFAGMDEASFEDAVTGLSENDLPLEALPILVDKTEQAVRLQKLWMLASLVARTGNPDAVPWLLSHAKVDDRVRKALGQHLLQLGRRTQAEPVRVALRELARQAEGSGRAELLLALLAMHDTASLAILADHPDLMQGTRHPYGTGENAQPIGPLAYLLMDQPDPPHGFSEAEVVEFLRRLFADGGPQQLWLTAAEIDRVPDRLVLELAAKATGKLIVRGTGGQSARESCWQEVVARRIAAEAEAQGPLHRWLLGAVGTAFPALRVVTYASERDFVVVRPELERMLAGDDEDLAVFAFGALRDKQPPLDFEALTTSKHPGIVELAGNHGLNTGTMSVATAIRLLPTFPNQQAIVEYCGGRFAIEAVPALMPFLQHEDRHVREAAREALTKIRTVHEQKSYWDRITKGLDASPSSAAEKLLLQAKPGAPRAQRLLAIPSLGALGVPEALPFLIEWSQDADAEVAVAASKAIQQIHLNPRR